MKRWWIAVLFTMLFLVLTFTFVFGLRLWLRDHLAAPLQAILMRMQILWRGQDPDMVWAIFLLLMVFLILYSFPPVMQSIDQALQKRRVSTQQGPALVDLAKTDSSSLTRQQGRLEFWLVEIDQIYRTQPVVRLAVIELKKLILEIIAFQQELESRTQAERWLEANVDKIPVELYQVFHPPSPKVKGRHPWYQFWKNLMSSPIFNQNITPQQLEVIIEYLEGHTQRKAS
jgi:hypothetical protein